MTTLMVHMQLGRPNQRLLTITRDLAERRRASVIGIAACRLPSFPRRSDDVAGARSSDWELERELADAESEFRAALHGRTIEWRSAATPVALASFLAEQARAADLVITGVARSGKSTDSAREANVEHLVLEAGRPILIVPPFEGEINLRRVLVGWSNSRATRRAVLDALPFLKEAEHVAVCEIAEEKNLPAARAQLLDLVAWLKRNDIAAEAFPVLSAADDAASLNAVASDQGAGIIVAGADGHSRFYEWLLGSMTTGLLARSERCLCLSY